MAFSYLGKLTDTADKVSGDTYSLGNIDFGAAHPNALAVLAVFGGNFNGSTHTITVGGVTATFIVQVSSFANLLRCAVPAGGAQAIVVNVSTGGMSRVAVCAWVGYPASATPLAGNTTSAAGTTDAVLNNLTVQNGGAVILAGGQAATLGTFTGTWTGAETPVEDEDFQLEAVSSIWAAHFNATANSSTDDFTLAESTSGNKVLAYASFGPEATVPPKAHQYRLRRI